MLGLFDSELELASAFTCFIESLYDNEQTTDPKGFSPRALDDLQEKLAGSFGEPIAMEEILHGKTLLEVYDAAVALSNTPQRPSAGEVHPDQAQQAPQNQEKAPVAGSHYDNRSFSVGNARPNGMRTAFEETDTKYVQYIPDPGEPKACQHPEPIKLDTSENIGSKRHCPSPVIDLTDDRPEFCRNAICKCPSAGQMPNAPHLKHKPPSNVKPLRSFDFRASEERLEYQTPRPLRAGSGESTIKREEGLSAGWQATNRRDTPQSFTAQMPPTPAHSHREDPIAPFIGKENRTGGTEKGGVPDSNDDYDGSFDDNEETFDAVAVTPRTASSKHEAETPATKVSQRWPVVYFAMEKEVNGKLHNRVMVRDGQPPGAFLVYNEDQEDNDYQTEGENDGDDHFPDRDIIRGSYDLYLDGDRYIQNEPNVRIMLQRFSNHKPGMPMLDFSVVCAALSPKVRLARRTKCGRANAVDVEFATYEDAHKFTVDLAKRVYRKNRSDVAHVRVLLNARTAGGIEKGIATECVDLSAQNPSNIANEGNHSKDLITMFRNGPNVPDAAEGLSHPCFCRICRRELHKMENSNPTPSKSNPAAAKPKPASAKRKTDNPDEGISVKKRGKRPRKMKDRRVESSTGSVIFAATQRERSVSL